MISTQPLIAPEKGHETYPKGRVCSRDDCGTILRRSNPTRRCELHRAARKLRTLDYQRDREAMVEALRDIMETP